jgi:DNA-binding NtrC family response regulator
MKQIVDTARKIALSDVNILLTGENGVGKNFLAAFIHAHSKRKEGPYIAVNCLAMPEGLIESELFGHEKGAFTDAKARKLGSFERADNGTLFLEEIGDISLAAQGKMLKAIEEKQFYRVGSEQLVHSSVRIIAATNQNLDAAIQEKRFREDLFFRLKEIEFAIPPLRERQEDIPLLLDHYVAEFCKEAGKEKMTISKAALAQLLHYDWPGNIRELKNAVRTAVLLNESQELWLENFPFTLKLKDEAAAEVSPEDCSLERCIERHVRSVLKYTHFNKSEAAQLLGISRPRLDRYIKSFNISK